MKARLEILEIPGLMTRFNGNRTVSRSRLTVFLMLMVDGSVNLALESPVDPP